MAKSTNLENTIKEEAQRVYERTLLFVFLMAARKVLPGTRIRVENSTAAGLYIRLPEREAPVTEQEIAEIKGEMRRVIESDLPFNKKEYTCGKAIKHFWETGEEDKALLMQFRTRNTITLYECEGFEAYFYGKMAPSTGSVKVFDLIKRGTGMELCMPNANDLSECRKSEANKLLSENFAETAKWAEILGCENIGQLHAMTDHGELREFIRVNEALQGQKICAIAQKFAESGARLLLIAGPSSSGKTTFANRLYVELRALGKHPVKISMDDYYRDRDTMERDENGELDLETIDALNLPLFNEHLVRILKGEEVKTPSFDFESGKSIPETHSMRVDVKEPIIIEGIHALNERLTASVPREQKFLVYISALTTLNLDDYNRIHTTDMRLLRRIVRDYKYRAYSARDTIAMWQSVRNGEEKYIFPYQDRADVMFNSSLFYEASILKKYAYPLLTAIGEDDPYYVVARRLVKFLNYVRGEEMEDEIPLNSLLREFVGGSCFYRDQQ